MSYIKNNNLKINSVLYEFINKEVIPGTNVKSDEFWNKFEKAVHELAPINKALIQKREKIQKKMDDWHKKNAGKDFNKEEYTSFLKSISYLVETKEDFKINTSNVDEEISSIAGPQLVVPLSNKRYAINAANSRWGSLYDALYGTDIIPYKDKFKIGKDYNERRGKEVIKFAKTHLDMFFPIDNCSLLNAL